MAATGIQFDKRVSDVGRGFERHGISQSLKSGVRRTEMATTSPFCETSDCPLRKFKRQRLSTVFQEFDRSEPPPPSFEESWSNQGFAVLRGVVPLDVIEWLRAESEHLSSSHKVSQTDAAERSPSLQVFPTGPAALSAHERQTITARSSEDSDGAVCRETHRSIREGKSPMKIGRRGECVLQTWARRALPGNVVRLFNESHIVTPPNVKVSSGWSTCAKRLLESLNQPPDTQVSDFVTLWCPLDPSRNAQGGLRLVPMAHEAAFASGDLSTTSPRDAVVNLHCDPGDVVAVSSRCWHYSGPNLGATPIRVFCAQFCGPTLLNGGDPSALVFAPCDTAESSDPSG